MRKKVISLFMAVCMLFVSAWNGHFLIQVSAKAISAQEMSKKFAELKQKYPENSVWNGSYKNLSWECMGWAETVCDYLFGENPRNWGQQTNWNNLCVGDHVRINNNGHSIVITNIKGDTIYYADCNAGLDNRVHWNKTMSRSQLISKATWFKSQPDNWVRTLDDDKVNPTITNLRVISANESSFNISADLDDNVAVKSVWLNVYGPGGNKGYSVSASKGVFNHTIKYSDYGGYGSYSVHAYVSDTSDNQGSQGLNNFYPSANYGDGAFAVILNKSIWKPIEVCDDGFVRLGTEDGTAKHVWRFNREGDGTYKITSAQNGRVLDVQRAGTDDGTKVGTYEDKAENNQRWILFEKNGGYILKPKHTNKVLDLANGSTEDGTQLQIYGSNGTDAQIFAIYGANDVQLTAPTITVNTGTSSTKTLFEWNNVYGEKRFDVKIWKNKLFEGDAYHIEWGTHSPYSIKLPAGHYEAYVDAANELQCLRSNVVAFDVAQDTSQLYVLSNVTADDTSYIINSDINLLNQPAAYTVALYSSDKRLLNIKAQNIQSGTVSVQENISKHPDAKYIKVFLWDSLDSMEPLCDSEKITL